MSKRGHSETLHRLLEVAVDAWGPKAVYATLEKVVPSEHRPTYARKKTLKAKGNTTLELVRRLQVPPKRKKLLLHLAEQFEQKKFLPALADARNFLEMRGVSSSGLTSRSRIFGHIVPLLVDMSDEGLGRLVETVGRSGPAKLGPLSDAIRQTGHALRGNRREDDKTVDAIASETLARPKAN